MVQQVVDLQGKKKKKEAAEEVGVDQHLLVDQVVVVANVVLGLLLLHVRSP